MGDCVPYRIVGKEATQVEGGLGSKDCLVESSLVIDVGYFRFPTVSDSTVVGQTASGAASPSRQ